MLSLWDWQHISLNPKPYKKAFRTKKSIVFRRNDWHGGSRAYFVLYYVSDEISIDQNMHDMFKTRLEELMNPPPCPISNKKKNRHGGSRASSYVRDEISGILRSRIVERHTFCFKKKLKCASWSLSVIFFF
jgi:hypothetical protein